MTLSIPGKGDLSRVEGLHLSPCYSSQSAMRHWAIDMHSGGGGRYFRIGAGSASTRIEVEEQVLREMRRARKVIDDYESSAEFLAALAVINHNPFPEAVRK